MELAREPPTSIGKSMDFDEELPAERCPVELSLQVVQNELMFKWRCTSTLSDEGYSARSILIVDSSSFPHDEPTAYLVEMFYRRLALGHFLKVLYVGMSLRQPWIEKTAEKFNCAGMCSQSDSESNLLRTLKYAIHQTNKHNEVTDISIVSNGVALLQRLRKLRDIMESLGYFYPATVFLRTEVKQHERKSGFHIYSYSNEEELRNEMKRYFKKKQRTKIASCQLRLEPINGDMMLKKHENSSSNNSWLNEGDCLVKNNYFMMDNVEYVETLSINNFNYIRMMFRLEFAFELTDSRKYLMTTVFSMEAEEKTGRDGDSVAVVLKNHVDRVTERLTERFNERFTEANSRVVYRPQSVIFGRHLMASTHDI